MIYGTIEGVRVFVMSKNTEKLKGTDFIAVQSITTGETAIIDKSRFKQVNNIIGWFK